MGTLRFPQVADSVKAGFVPTRYRQAFLIEPIRKTGYRFSEKIMLKQ